jgi:trimeric autotransporter adhesin
MTSIRRRNHRIKIAQLMLILSGLFTLASAQATTLCVNSVPLLKVALIQATILTQQPITIQIVQGTYDLNEDMTYNFIVPTTLEGGYTAGCASRQVSAANTQINLQGHQVFLTQKVAAPAAQLNLDGMTFAHASRVYLIGGQDVSGGADDEGSIRLSNVRLSDISSGNNVPITMTTYIGSIKLENVLIDQIATSNFIAVDIVARDGASVAINHLSADIPASKDFNLEDVGDDSLFTIHNSIIWNSDGSTSVITGALEEDSAVVLVNSVFHGLFIVGAATSIQSQINAAPGWINPAAGNYHLSVSPVAAAINTGTFNVPGGEPLNDIEGNSHFVGSAPDIGAYESAFSDQTVLIVSNTLDSGFGSLRQAITTANQSLSPPKQIKFDIRGAGNVPLCPAVIELDTVLPTITGRMTIDGYTQPFSTRNTHASAFNAQLCVIVKPASGTLSNAFTVPNGSFGSLTLRGLGIGGFGQPVRILGGQSSLIAGNQFGGVATGVNLPGAGLNAITIGPSATGDLIVGGLNAADRNVIGGAEFSGIDNQANGGSAFTSCQIVNNLIGLTPNGNSALANSFGINSSGSGCEINGNRIAGNSIINLWLNGSDGNIVQRNAIGVTAQNLGLLNDATGILVTGANNIIGAGGNGGTFSANTIRFNVAAGVVIRGSAATGNSVKANVIYDNGVSNNAMDIDLQASDASTGPNANDGGDLDSGPNQFQNFPVPTALNYTAAGSIDRPATLSGVLDAKPGTYRIDAYFSNAANIGGTRGHAEVFLGLKTVTVGGAPAAFTMAVLVPNQLPGGVISFTATDAAGNTSELGTALSIVTPLIFSSGFE